MPTIVVNQNTANIAVPLSGVNGLAKSGPGTLILSNADSLSGTVFIDTSSTTTAEGIVRAAFPGALMNVTNIQIRDNNGGSSTLQLDGSSGNITNAASIALNGRNNTVVAIENLSGSNTLSGGITINVGGADYLIQSDAGQLTLGGNITSVATGNRIFTFQGNGNFNITGSIQNGSATNGIVKTGSGTLTFSGVNTYTNTTTVNGGTLLVNGTNGLSAVTIASSAALDGQGLVRGPVMIQPGGTLSPGIGGIGTLKINNTLTNSGTLLVLVNKSDSTLTNSTVSGIRFFSIGGTLALTNIGTGTLTVGDSFKIFSATNSVGTFTAISPPMPGPGLLWNTSALASSGVLSVSLGTVQPQVSQVSLSNTDFVLAGSGGAAGYSFSELSSTDLTVPLSNWPHRHRHV